MLKWVENSEIHMVKTSVFNTHFVSSAIRSLIELGLQIVYHSMSLVSAIQNKSRIEKSLIGSPMVAWRRQVVR